MASQSLRVEDRLGVDDGPAIAPSPQRTQSEPLPEPKNEWGVRSNVTFSERRFDTTTLPDDIQRVYGQLAEKFGEEYGLLFVFTVRTAVELHRAWHMTLLTSKILQQIKDRFALRMTWNLGVVRLKFRVEDGGFELHRKVPYDYDSEFQDLYMKIAVALVEGHITVHEALIFQAETKLGYHTAKSGLFLRENPGRLVLYPLEAATCTVIFFGGDWKDAGVAACCGFASGLVEYGLGSMGGDAKVLTDALVGMVTGIVGGIFYRYQDPTYCLSSIFLGTLYWFFYGTAFVIGILEIIAGELETGVTRFIAVSVKTFVLSMGASIGLQIVLKQNVFQAWVDQGDFCNEIDLDDQWWRIPLYLLCSVSVLGQYRAPIVQYWRGLVIMLIGYEVQYQLFKYFGDRHIQDFLDTAISNITAAMAAVIAACTLSVIVDTVGYYYNARLLQKTKVQKFSAFGELLYRGSACYVRATNALGLGRTSKRDLDKMEKKLRGYTAELKDPGHPRSSIRLPPQEEAVLLEAIVDSEGLNIWSLLMPAVYQLVPGSLIARLWFNAIFPPPLEETKKEIEVTEDLTLTYSDSASSPEADSVFYGLFVISASLSLGLLFGFAAVQMFAYCSTAFFSMFKCFVRQDQTENEEEREKERIQRTRFRQQGVTMENAPQEDPDQKDPVLYRESSRSVWLHNERLQHIRSLDTEDAIPEDKEAEESKSSSNSLEG